MIDKLLGLLRGEYKIALVRKNENNQQLSEAVFSDYKAIAIGQRFKEIRLAKKNSQVDFAFTLSINQSQLSKIEKGEVKPTLRICRSLMFVYGVRYEWIVAGSGEKFMTQTEHLKFMENNCQ